MKKSLFLSAIVLCVMAFNSCNKENTDPKPSLAVEIDDITAYNANIYVNPTTDHENDMYSVLYIDAKTFNEKYGNMSDEELIAADYETYLKYIAQFEAMGQYVELSDLLHKGATILEADQLQANTKYYVWAEFMDQNGKSLDGKVYKAEFTTLDIVRSKISFSFSQEGNNLTITPSTDEYYYVTAYAVDIAQQYNYTPESWFAFDLSESAKYFAGELILRNILSSGAKTFNIDELLFDFWGNNDYIKSGEAVKTIILAGAANDGGQVLSDIAQYDLGEYQYNYTQKAAIGRLPRRELPKRDFKHIALKKI